MQAFADVSVTFAAIISALQMNCRDPAASS